MWALDRLSSHNTSPSSQPPSRPYSPIPRRSTLGPSRPSLSHQDRSLSLLLPSTSHTSLPATARFPPRNSSKPAPLPEVEDPVTALGRILGGALRDGGPSQAPETSLSKPSILERDIAFNGLSLQEYVSDRPPGYSTQYNQQSVEQYEVEREKFEDLRRSISGCDDVLESVEKYLSSFQADLSAVSAEIETLQARSTSLNEKLENRKKVEKVLGPAVDRFTIPPQLVKKIVEGAVDESWAQTLEQLQRRAKGLDTATDVKDVRAVQEVKPLIEDLSKIAVERIRDHFANQIRALRSPNINAQTLQQQRWLPYQPLFAFLASHQAGLAAEIMQAYSNTMRWYYDSHFTRYYAALMKLKLYSTDRHDVLGTDVAAAAKARGSSSSPRTDIFSLARRGEILKGSSASAMPSHAAEGSKAAHHIETPFMAYNLALIDNASFEYSFLTSFFSTRSTFTKSSSSSIDHSAISRHFNIIFTPAISLATAMTKDLITESYDALGVLLLIRLTQNFAFHLQRRKVPGLDSYINGTNMLLWPRFQSLLDANCTALKQLTSTLPNRPSGAASAAGTIASLSGSANSTSSGASTAPHPVTQRFANFARGIIDLSSEAPDNEPVANSLGRLRSEFVLFLSKLGASMPSGEKGKRDRKRLLANNYSLVLAVLGDATGRLADETRKRFEELMEEVG